MSVGELGDSPGNFGSPNPVLEVIGPDGRSIGVSTSESNGLIEFNATLSGVYTAVVSESGNDQTLDYQIRTLTLPGSPLLINGRDSELANGEQVSSGFGLGGFNLHRFDAAFGESVRVSVGELGDSPGGFGSPDPVLEVIGPDGRSIDVSTSEANGLIEFNATLSGVYTAVVSESGNDQTLDYQIRTLTLPGDPLLISDRDSELANGEQVSSGFGLGGFNLHRFDAAFGESVRVSVGELGDSPGNFGSPDPVLEVIGPDGRSIGVSTSESNGLIEFNATLSGVYTAVVSENGNDQALDYQIRTLTLPGNPLLINGRDSELANGEQVSSDFGLGEFNVHRFAAAFGDLVTVEVSDTGDSPSAFSSADPVLQVFGPNGQLVAPLATSEITAVINFAALRSGIYTAVISESNNDQPLTSSLVVNGITPPPAFHPGRLQQGRTGRRSRLPVLDRPRRCDFGIRACR